VHTVKEYEPVILVASHILNLGTGCWCGQLHSDSVLPQGKESQHLFSRRLSGHQRWSGCCIEEKASFPCWKPDHESSFYQAGA